MRVGREHRGAAARALTDYEKTQAFNRVTAWLHGFRYRLAEAALANLRLDHPMSLIDIGCGPATLYGLAEKIGAVNYTGIEISAEFVAAARDRYAGRPNFRVLHESALTALERISAPDVIIALETLEHIPERDVVRLIERIAAVRPQLFICSVPVEVGPAIWLKNVGSLLSGYRRHAEYTWPETFWAGLYQLDRLPPHGTGHKGFDWRWLAQTIRHNMRIRAIRTFPFGLPAALSTSVFMICEPR